MGLEQVPLWAQLGVGALVVVVLVLGAGTKRFGRLWVFGWYAARLELEIAEWKGIALRAMGNTAEVAAAAKRHTTLSPEAAELARRVIAEASGTQEKGT